MKSDLKAVFFDIDDTLFDRKEAQHKVIKLMIDKYRSLFADLDASDIEKAFVESDRISFKTIPTVEDIRSFRIVRTKIFLDLLGLNHDAAETLTNAYVDIYPKVNASTPCAKSTVKELSKRYQLGVISNGFSDVQYEKLRSVGVLKYFESIILSYELGVEKPNSRIFTVACESVKRIPNECLYIGDSYEDDIIGAKKAGMVACWYNPNGDRKNEHDIHPDFIISRLDQILTYMIDSIPKE
jgi:putative hydrolase of the HAD superfamily